MVYLTVYPPGKAATTGWSSARVSIYVYIYILYNIIYMKNIRHAYFCIFIVRNIVTHAIFIIINNK